jgi:hypothetical protein
VTLELSFFRQFQLSYLQLEYEFPSEWFFTGLVNGPDGLCVLWWKRKLFSATKYGWIHVSKIISSILAFYNRYNVYSVNQFLQRLGFLEQNWVWIEFYEFAVHTVTLEIRGNCLNRRNNRQLGLLGSLVTSVDMSSFPLKSCDPRILRNYFCLKKSSAGFCELSGCRDPELFFRFGFK